MKKLILGMAVIGLFIGGALIIKKIQVIERAEITNKATGCIVYNEFYTDDKKEIERLKAIAYGVDDKSIIDIYINYGLKLELLKINSSKRNGTYDELEQGAKSRLCPVIL